MLLEKNNSCLVLVDVQEKLIPFIKDSEALIGRCQWLIRLSHELKVPYLVAEQYPQGLGSTLQALQPIVPNNNVVKKVHFSCWREPLFQNALQALNKKQVVLMGIETHVCVLQTAFDLQTAGYHVFVVIDAVGSRHEMDYKYALKRMKQAGIELVTSEMVFFEWVEKAATPEFKMLSKAFLQ